MRFELKMLSSSSRLFSNVIYLNKIEYYDYSKAKLSRASRFLDNAKYTFHPLVLSRITEKLGYSNTLGLKLSVPSNSQCNYLFLIIIRWEHIHQWCNTKNKSQMEKQICVGFFFSYWRLRTIHLERDCGPINWFNPDAFLCLSQNRTWISNANWHGIYLCSLIWGERWLFVFFYIVGITDHHCLKFLVIKKNSQKCKSNIFNQILTSTNNTSYTDETASVV